MLAGWVTLCVSNCVSLYHSVLTPVEGASVVTWPLWRGEGEGHRPQGLAAGVLLSGDAPALELQMQDFFRALHLQY